MTLGSGLLMTLEIAEELRAQMRRIQEIAETATVDEVRRELNGVALMLAQLAETLARAAFDASPTEVPASFSLKLQQLDCAQPTR